MLHHNISTISTNIIICWDISIDDWKSLIDTLGSTSFYMLWLPFEGLKDFTFIIYGTDAKSNKLILTSKAPQNLIVLQMLVVSYQQPGKQAKQLFLHKPQTPFANMHHIYSCRRPWQLMKC